MLSISFTFQLEWINLHPSYSNSDILNNSRKKSSLPIIMGTVLFSPHPDTPLSSWMSHFACLLLANSLLSTVVANFLFMSLGSNMSVLLLKCNCPQGTVYVLSSYLCYLYQGLPNLLHHSVIFFEHCILISISFQDSPYQTILTLPL